MYYISEPIVAYKSTAVASLSQRNLATLPGHPTFIPVSTVFNHLAKASGFCLYFYLGFQLIASNI